MNRVTHDLEHINDIEVVALEALVEPRSSRLNPNLMGGSRASLSPCTTGWWDPGPLSARGGSCPKNASRQRPIFRGADRRPARSGARSTRHSDRDNKRTSYSSVEIQIYDAYNYNRLPGAFCTNCSSLTASDTKFAPIAPNAVAYFAAVGTDADPAGASGQQIVATNHNGCWFPSWLNPLKFYAFRISSGDSSVILSTDSGGANIFDPYKIQFFNVATGSARGSRMPRWIWQRHPWMRPPAGS